jgi:FkbM family methyltransferase
LTEGKWRKIVETGIVTRKSELRVAVTASAVLAIARYTRWLEPEMLGLSRVVGPGDVCIDVGAAAGLYTVPLSRLVGPSGIVHSIEPLPFAWPLWNRVLGARDNANVQHHSMALGSEPGEATMSVPMGRYGLVTGRSFVSQKSTGLGSNVEFAQHINFPVTVDTLDGLAARVGLDRLNFMKVDVEGSELQVLHGGKDVIDSFRPTMLLEIEARHTERFSCSPDDVVGWLAERGYLMYTWQHGWKRADQVTATTRNYLFRAR